MRTATHIRWLGAAVILLLASLLPVTALAEPIPGTKNVDYSPELAVPSPPTSPPPVPSLRCGVPAADCLDNMLAILNRDRSHSHLVPLQLNRLQSAGSATCAGSLGHSTAMARSGAIWHINPRYPKASFPNNICLRVTAVSENVGMAITGDLLHDLQVMDSGMMAEPHSTHYCARTINHACNILNPAFHQVGIGILYSKGTTWLTEDFFA